MTTTFQSATLATPPSGLIVATDQIGGTDYQRMKVTWGTTGSVTDASTTAPLPVSASPALLNTSSLTNANVTFSTSGVNTLVAGVAGQTVRVYRACLTAAAAVTLAVWDSTAGSTLATVPLATNGNFSFDTFASGQPLFVTASSGALAINSSAAVAVKGFIQYTQS